MEFMQEIHKAIYDSNCGISLSLSLNTCALILRAAIGKYIEDEN
jgi:hypothetical protein